MKPSTNRIFSIFLSSLMGIIFISTCFWFLNPTQTASAATTASTRQVNTAGSDTGDCIGSACATVSFALSQSANGDVINVAAGTYNDTFTVGISVTIQGEDAATTILQAASSYNVATSRVITIAENVSATLDSLTIQHGNAISDGGGIQISGTLSILNSNVISNTAGEDGGGINNVGILTLTNSTVSYNTAVTDDGGGIDDDYGTVVISGSVVSHNTAGDDGGGIDSDGSLTIINSIINDNLATGDGGGLDNDDGPLNLTNTMISTNTAGVDGGGIFNYDGSLNLTSTTISTNTAEDTGGGVYNRYGIITLTNSTVSTNTANLDGGGIFNYYGDVILTNTNVDNNTAADVGGGIFNYWYLTMDGGSLNNNNAIAGGGLFNLDAVTCLQDVNIQGNNADADGGGILNIGSDLCLGNSTVISNTAAGSGEGYGYGGGIYNVPLDADGEIFESYLFITNTTVSQNTAIYGGGIFNEESVVDLTHSTIVSNTADQRGGGVFNDLDADLYVQNSIVLGNAANVGPDCRGDGDFYGEGVNLVGSSTGCFLSGGTTMTSATPGNEVESLENNGGNTLTHALTSASQAIDAGDSFFCPSADQRGETRDDWGCDIGAYEMKFSDGDTVVKPVATGDTVTFGPTLARVYVDDDGGCLTGITVQRVDNNHADATEGIKTGRYWTITPVSCENTLTVTLTLPLTATTSVNDKLCRWDTGSTEWDCGVTANNSPANSGPTAMPNIVTRQNVTQFSDWAVGDSVGPTAVSLQSFSPQSTTTTQIGLVIVALMAGLTAVTLNIRRRFKKIRYK